MPDLSELINNGKRRESGVSPARRKEKQVRATKALNLARQALTNLYHADFEDLYRQALEMLNAERGPLPD